MKLKMQSRTARQRRQAIENVLIGAFVIVPCALAIVAILAFGVIY